MFGWDPALHAGASNFEAGCYITQSQDRETKPLVDCSFTVLPAEQNYDTYKRELAAIVNFRCISSYWDVRQRRKSTSITTFAENFNISPCPPPHQSRRPAAMSRRHSQSVQKSQKFSSVRPHALDCLDVQLTTLQGGKICNKTIQTIYAFMHIFILLVPCKRVFSTWAASYICTTDTNLSQERS